MVEVVKHDATGRRKSSIAHVIMTPGSGSIKVNKRPFKEYFPCEADQTVVLDALQITNNIDKFDIIARVNGGGISGQAGAMKLAISRALSSCDDVTKSILKKAKFLTRDARMKERQKPGQKGARKKFQWVKR